MRRSQYSHYIFICSLAYLKHSSASRLPKSHPYIYQGYIQPGQLISNTFSSGECGCRWNIKMLGIIFQVVVSGCLDTRCSGDQKHKWNGKVGPISAKDVLSLNFCQTPKEILMKSGPWRLMWKFISSDTKFSMETKSIFQIKCQTMNNKYRLDETPKQTVGDWGLFQENWQKLLLSVVYQFYTNIHTHKQKTNKKNYKYFEKPSPWRENWNYDSSTVRKECFRLRSGKRSGRLSVNYVRLLENCLLQLYSLYVCLFPCQGSGYVTNTLAS